MYMYITIIHILNNYYTSKLLHWFHFIFVTNKNIHVSDNVYYVHANKSFTIDKWGQFFVVCNIKPGASDVEVTNCVSKKVL